MVPSWWCHAAGFAAYLFPCSVEESHDAIGLPHPGEVRAMDGGCIGAGGVLPGKQQPKEGRGKTQCQRQACYSGHNAAFYV